MRMLILSIITFVPNAVLIYADSIFIITTVTLDETLRFMLYVSPAVANLVFVTIYLLHFKCRQTNCLPSSRGVSC